MVTWELIINQLLKVYSQPNNKNVYSFLGPKESVEILTQKGADIHHTNKAGGPALFYAAERGNSECLTTINVCLSENH